MCSCCHVQGSSSFDLLHSHFICGEKNTQHAIDREGCTVIDMLGNIDYRPLNPATDVPRLRELHDVCFPVKYDDRYYNWLSSSHCIALVATSTEVRGEQQQPLAESDDTNVSPVLSVPPPPPALTHAESVVVGFIIGKIKYVEGPLLMNPVVYIATFGVDPGLQGRGVGHEILERFVSMVSDASFLATPACADFASPPNGWSLRSFLNRLISPKPLSQVWLHCLADDAKVVGFYAKRDFIAVERIPMYYEFGGGLHDAQVMVREVIREDPAAAAMRKGNRKGTARAWHHRSWWDVLCGTTPAGALEGQDDLDDVVVDGAAPKRSALAMCGFGRSMSTLGCYVAGLVGTCVAAALLFMAALRIKG